MIDHAEAIFDVVFSLGTLWTLLLVGIGVYFCLLAPRLKIDKSSPTDSPRVLSAKEIEDLEDRGKIW